MNKLTVSIIIPNINGESIMRKNMPKVILAKKYSKNQIKEIIMVDNASIDKSVTLVRQEFPEVKIIRHKVDRGFSASVNTGLRAATGDLVVLLNTDVIPKINFLEKVIQDFDDDRVFAVSLHEVGYGPAIGSFNNGYIKLDKGIETNKRQSTFYVSGGTGVFRRSVFVELGGMDERLLSPFYWEDIDLGYRALKRGYKLFWNPFGVVVHHHESTISKFPKKYVDRVKERNQLLMLWKNIHSFSFLKKHIIAVFLRCVKHPGYIRIVLMALFRFRILIRSRQKEIKESILSDEAVFEKFI